MLKLQTGFTGRTLDLALKTKPIIADNGSDERARLYNTARWHRARRAFLQAHPLCATCKAKGFIVAARAVDHVAGHQHSDWLARFWDPDGWQALCLPCHNAKAAAEGAAWARGILLDAAALETRRLPMDLQPSRVPLTIVTGAPDSGKSTYVRDRIRPGHLWICVDRIKAELSGKPEHWAPDRWVKPALERRNALLRSLATITRYSAAWFIVGAPDPAERRRWHTMLGGELVVLSTSLAECILRINDDRSRPIATKARLIGAARAWWGANPDTGGR